MKATLLTALSIHTEFNFRFTEIESCSSRCYFIFNILKYFFFVYRWHYVTLFWKMILVYTFAISYPLSELINTSLYFRIALFVFSIIWSFREKLTEVLILNNFKVAFYNITIMTLYKKVIIFTTAIFNRAWISKEFINS